MLSVILHKVGLYIYGLSTQRYYLPFINFMRTYLFAFFIICLAASIPGDGIEGCDGHESRF